MPQDIVIKTLKVSCACVPVLMFVFVCVCVRARDVRENLHMHFLIFVCVCMQQGRHIAHKFKSGWLTLMIHSLQRRASRLAGSCSR